jgi:hypothetical protein
MPTTGGVYTPLTDYQHGLAQRYMQNKIAQGGGTRASIIQWTIARIGVDASDASALQSDYRKSQRAVDAAAIMRRTHNRTPLPGEIGPVQGDPNRTGQYRIEILVTSTNQATGQQSVQRTYIYSPSPMSLDNVRSNVDANRQYYIRTMQSPQYGGTSTTNITLRTIVLSVGRVQ